MLRSALIQAAGGILRFTGDKTYLSVADKDALRFIAVRVREVADSLATTLPTKEEK